MGRRSAVQTRRPCDEDPSCYVKMEKDLVMRWERKQAGVVQGVTDVREG